VAAAAAVLVAGSGLAACGAAGDKTDAKAELQIWVRKPPGSSTEKTDQQLAAAFTGQTGIPAKVTARSASGARRRTT
jgi:multiple sugar transport system substrate-binding protein